MVKLIGSSFVLSIIVNQACFAAASACNTPESGICIETNNPEIPLECEGTVVDACPLENRIGTCLFGTEAAGVMSRFYSAYPGNAKADCEAANGVFLE